VFSNYNVFFVSLLNKQAQAISSLEKFRASISALNLLYQILSLYFSPYEDRSTLTAKVFLPFGFETFFIMPTLAGGLKVLLAFLGLAL
jgi:hypothetical protein